MLKRVLLFCCLLTILLCGFLSSQTMHDFYRRPQIEEGIHNIILQNRCGNRISLLFGENQTDLEFVYKPNAFRRKEFRARNFSNRDNFTVLFPEFFLPDIKADYVKMFDYDPFVTRFEIEAPSKAKNSITVVNVIDENVFALTARCPLLISVRPFKAFDIKNGLLSEKFIDRGEEIVSFIHFDSFEENRFRVLKDGRYVLQIFENEVVLVGGEENRYQVDRVLRKLGGMDLNSLIARNEAILAPQVNKGRLHYKNPDFQKVMDLNRRMVFSGIDEGGACFGALNRIYHLIWVRDGAMTTSLMARAGNPDLIKLWAPFLLKNPSRTRNDKNEIIPQYLQMVGTRWTKSEDDGIYYAMLSLYTHFQTTGSDALLCGEEISVVLNAVDLFLHKAWDEDKQLIGSDTRGETTLEGNPYYGYDTVNGKMYLELSSGQVGGKIIRRAYSLYNNVNTYNVLKMAASLLDQRQDLDSGRKQQYLAKAKLIRDNLRSQFVNDKGYFYADYLEYTDGTGKWIDFAQSDYWEYAWAVSLGPFYPLLDVQLNSARMVKKVWPTIRGYGYCPWNTLSRMLKEYGMTDGEYEAMLRDEVNEALMLTKKYPMVGALTEYYKQGEGWRTLPFTAGSFFFSTASLMLQSLPCGIAVRASDRVDTIDNFQFRLSGISARAAGHGDVVTGFDLNGKPVEGTLQIPSSQLRAGQNQLNIKRGKSFPDFRLYSSTAELLNYEKRDGKLCYEFFSPVPVQLVFEN